MSLNQQLVKSSLSSTVNFNGSGAGTVKGGPTFDASSFAIDHGSLYANISTSITTTSLSMTASWQVSQDGTTWRELRASPGTAYATISPAGTGAPITTNYMLAFPHALPSHPFVRIAVTSGGATGVLADAVTVSYNFLRRNYMQ